jgi:hypothetical protein
MIKRTLLLFLLFLISNRVCFSQIGSTFIFLKTGQIMNVSISLVHKGGLVESNGTGFPFFTIDSVSTSDSTLVNRIEAFLPEIEVEQNGQKYLINMSKLFPPFINEQSSDKFSLPKEPSSSTTPVIKYERPYIILLPLSFVCAGLAWEYFSDLSQLPDGPIKTRRTILGITFTIAGILNMFIALKSVEVKATSNSLVVWYRL